MAFDEEKADVMKEAYRRLKRVDVHTEQITVKETHLGTQRGGSVAPVEQEVVKTYLYMDGRTGAAYRIDVLCHIPRPLYKRGS